MILGVCQHLPILVKIGEKLQGTLHEDPHDFTMALFTKVTVVTNVPMVATDLLVTKVTSISMVRMSTMVT